MHARLVESGKMTGVSLEIVETTEVVKTPATYSTSSSYAIIGRVENDGSSVELTGKAAVRTNTVEITGKAAVKNDEGQRRTHMVHFTWTKLCLTCGLVSFLGVVLFARFVYIWQECVLRNGSTTWSVVRASIVLGSEVGLLVMGVLLFLLVPRMIVTWTTALVVKYILGVFGSGEVANRQMVRDGTKVAKEISWITITSVFEEGHAVAAAVLILCFTTTAVLRHGLTD